ncbi:MAG TPA: glycosyltransferase N-terminal domain-containing protein, partial [Gemmataceae bacterium]|nr:glycosyltransferase N-terminal domain-containing protein [Gemmataceae bacterium]
MRYLLDALYFLLFPLAALFLLRRKRRSGLWDRFLGRTHSQFRILHSAFRILFHGVSVGEIHLLRGIVREFRRRHPQWQCVISATTDSGFAEAQKWFGDLAVIRWPLDFSWAVERALAEVRPDLVVLAESEFWPNFLLAARRRRIAVVAVNVRLSPRSFRRYRWFRSLAGRWLRLLSHFAVQTAEYAEQLRQLGVPDERVSVTGSVKYDGVMMDRDNPKTAAFRELFNLQTAGLEDSPRGLVWVAGSTQAPEEEIVLAIFAKLRLEFSQLRLILVPRQPDRFDDVARLLESSQAPFIRRSALSRSQALPGTALRRGSASLLISPSPPASEGEGWGEGGEPPAS